MVLSWKMKREEAIEDGKILVAPSCLAVWGILRELSGTEAWFSLQSGSVTTLGGEGSRIMGYLKPLGLVGVCRVQ